jgi:hypothetical protein
MPWRWPSESARGRCAAGQRPEEPQQRGELLFDTAGKAIEQRDRQSGDVERRHEGGSGDRLEPTGGERRCHQARERVMVRRSIPGTADRRAKRAVVVPCSIAEINVTTVAR